MKKRLEAELISIAHRILKLKNHSELKQLHLETQKLYETLSVLKFVEENINIIQPKIDVDDIEQKLQKSFNQKVENIAVANEEIAFINNIEIPDEKIDIHNKVEILATAKDENDEESISENEDEILAVANDEIAEIENIPASADEVISEEKQILEEEILAVANDEKVEETIVKENEPIFIPEFETEIEEVKFDKKQEPIQISFDEFKFSEPIFEKKSDVTDVKQVILNEKLSQGINIGLNDKIAFVKHLFADSNEDYIRVLSQISTFDTYYETVNFINDIVKPDYNNWLDKDEYVLRFMEAVEKKFV